MEILRILLIEDSELDAKLTSATLDEGGIAHDVVRVQTAEDFAARVKDSTFDLIISNYILSNLSGMSALKLANEFRPDLPFIFLSGALGEELAIDSLKAGAADYVLKQRMVRLVPAVQRAVAEFRERGERKRADLKLREERRAGEEQYRFLAESIPQMVWTATAEGALDYCNRRWCDYTGMSVQHSLGAGWLSAVHRDDLPGVMDGWRSAVAGGDFEKEYRIRATDGEFRWHLSRAIPMRDAQGRTVRLFGTSTDIHDRRQNEQAIREAKESAEAASRAKDQFLAVLSHELRTPLMPVLTTVQTLNIDRDLPQHIRSDLEMIRRNVELEARLIDDLLDLTRIAKGKLQLNLESVDVHTSIASALEICRGDIASKRINAVTALRAARPIVLGDPARLQQVFWNLINNAIKFTPAGGTLTFRSEDAAEQRVHFTVTDTGIGIDAEVLPRIFDAFEQGQTTVTRKFGGLGLGLAISRALVTLHGGTITARSDGKDRGTTFSIELPLTRASLQPTRSRSPSSKEIADVGAATATQSVPDINILLVDDHEDTNRAMCRLLERLGYKVRTAQSVRTALEAAEQAPFDLLISDIGLPDGSGVDLMRQLIDRHKSSGASQPLRGIALSGFGMEEDIQRSRDAGFHDHLIKPVNFKRLETVIRELTSELDKA